MPLLRNILTILTGLPTIPGTCCLPLNITFSIPVIQFMLKIYQYMYNTYDFLIFLRKEKKNSSYNFWWCKINHSLKYHKFKYTGKEKMYMIHNHVIYKYLKYMYYSVNHKLFTLTEQNITFDTSYTCTNHKL